MTRGLLAVAMVSSAACIAEPAVELEVAWPSPPACQAISGAGVRASLWIGGFKDPCPLEVDQTTLAVSGRCGPVPTGASRPLAIIYSVAHPSTQASVPLAYFVSVVDLCGVDEPEGDAIATPFVDDGVHGVFVHQQRVIDDVLAETPEVSCGMSLPTAVAALKAQGLFTDGGLDSDGDCAPSQASCSNLEEACAGTVF